MKVLKLLRFVTTAIFVAGEANVWHADPLWPRVSQPAFGEIYRVGSAALVNDFND